LAGVYVNPEETPMNTLSKALVAAAAFAAIATSAFSQVPWEFNPGMAYMYAGPGKMSAMAMAAGEKNHEAMMKHATRCRTTPCFLWIMAPCTLPPERSIRPAISIGPDPSTQNGDRPPLQAAYSGK
jgi:hypothetical protein